MATTEEIKKAAILVRDATQIGENTAERVGGVLVDLADKSKELEDNIEGKAEKSEVDTELAKKFDKASVVQEFGDSEDKVVSQFALPFREIESPEFIKVIVDAEDHFLFGIQLDGSIEWGKGIPAPIRAKLQEIINQCQQDKTDILKAINAAKKELSASIAALQEGKVDKEEGKSLIEDEVKEYFRVIENEEFIHAVIDSEDRLLFGIYRESGKPYFPLNEMYHVEQNEEFFAVWLDAANHVLLGIRRDGQIIGEIHAVNALKQVISQLQSDVAALQEKVGAIDTNLKELLDVFSLQDNEEYLAVEQDAEGKILSATNPDGSHYIHNAKSETIPTEFSHIEDPEGRTEITTDAENKVMSYRDADGKKHEHDMEITNLDVSNLNLQGNSANNIQDALKANGFDVKTPIDWSNEESINISIPKCAKVNLITDKMPIMKSGLGKPNDTSDIDCYIEFWDMNGNYLKIPARISAQGQSSLAFVKKNIAIDLFSDEERTKSYKMRFGDWVAQDSFHLKSYYTDFFRGKGPVSYMLYEEMVKTRGINDDRPYKHLFVDEYKTSDYGVDSVEELDKNLDTGAKCFPQGFPVIVYQKGVFYGIYSWQLKKHRDNMHQDKKTAEHIHLDGVVDGRTLFGGVICWDEFEIRNPKNLYMQTKHIINGKETLEYNGDFPQEIMGEDSPFYDSSNNDMKRSVAVKKYIVSLSNRIAEINQAESEGKSTEEIKGLIEKYFMVSFIIDYILETNITGNGDAYNKNWQWTTYDGVQWVPNPYDHDGCFGAHYKGYYTAAPSKKLLGKVDSIPTGFIFKYYLPELKARWAELRDLNIFSTSHIIALLKKWCDRIGYDNFKQEYKKWNESPCNRKSYRNEQFWSGGGEQALWSSSSTYNKNDVVYYLKKAYKSLVDGNSNINPSTDNGGNWEDVTYNNEKTYNAGEYTYYGNTRMFRFMATKECKGEKPLLGFYKEAPNELGYFDSLYRVEKWLNENINYLDRELEYNV